MWSLTGLLNDLAKKERSLKLQGKRNARKYSWESNRQKILRKKSQDFISSDILSFRKLGLFYKIFWTYIKLTK